MTMYQVSPFCTVVLYLCVFRIEFNIFLLPQLLSVQRHRTRTSMVPLALGLHLPCEGYNYIHNITAGRGKGKCVFTV